MVRDVSKSVSDFGITRISYDSYIGIVTVDIEGFGQTVNKCDFLSEVTLAIPVDAVTSINDKADVEDSVVFWDREKLQLVNIFLSNTIYAFLD